MTSLLASIYTLFALLLVAFLVPITAESTWGVASMFLGMCLLTLCLPYVWVEEELSSNK